MISVLVSTVAALAGVLGACPGDDPGCLAGASRREAVSVGPSPESALHFLGAPSVAPICRDIDAPGVLASRRESRAIHRGHLPDRPLAPAPAISVPNGFRAEVYASGLERPTALAFGPDGLLYATQEGGEIVAVGRGSAQPRVVARGFRTPLGLAWSGRTLFVSAQGSLHRVELRGRRLLGRRTLVAGLPYGRHQQDNVVIGPDGRLYFGSGSTCDVCRERDRRSAAILSVRPDGRDLRVFATGLRNPFGLAFQPGTGRLFVSVNNADNLGPSEPAETIVIARRGQKYGWPDCWPSWLSRRLVGACSGVTPPLAYLEPHSSANGLAFWRGRLYVAEWGQYASDRWGRKVVAVNPRTGRVRAFADGFNHPLALAVAPRGGLLVADWGRGLIYRIH